MKLCMVATNSFSLKSCIIAIYSCKHEVHEANQCCNIELYLIKSCNVFLQLYLIKSCNIFLAVPCKFYLFILWHLTTECFCQKVFHTINTLFLLFFNLSITTEAPACTGGHYRCGDGMCLKANLVCDGNEDCEDGTDEKDCCKLAWELLRTVGMKITANYRWSPGVGVTNFKQISLNLLLLFHFSRIIEIPFTGYRLHIWQVPPQLSCGDTCKIWRWLIRCNRYFCNIHHAPLVGSKFLNNGSYLKTTVVSRTTCIKDLSLLWDIFLLFSWFIDDQFVIMVMHVQLLIKSFSPCICF